MDGGDERIGGVFVGWDCLVDETALMCFLIDFAFSVLVPDFLVLENFSGRSILSYYNLILFFFFVHFPRGSIVGQIQVRP